jgi:hypothetical protein
MAKNTNKRIPVKWVRDRAKAAYEKKDVCYVCGTKQDLELHHLHSVTILLDKWSEAKGYDISTDAGILAVRDEFIDTHRVELYDQVYTLCNRHHVALHSVYGKAPRLGSEPKQSHWIETQRAKHTGDVVESAPIPKRSFGSFFSEFT